MKPKKFALITEVIGGLRVSKPLMWGLWFVTYLTVLMYITLVGLGTNLFLGYCPLARMMYLLPWNRDERFSLNLLAKVFLSAPTPGQFKPASMP